jgi:hypothetical protein
MEGTGGNGGKGNTEPYTLSQVLLSNESIASKAMPTQKQIKLSKIKA